MKSKHGFTWFHRGVNDENLQLMINFKKHLLIKNLKEKSIHEYMKEISNWMKFLQLKKIKTFEANTEDLTEYLDRDISEARKTRILSVLSSFYKHNKKKRYCKVNIVEEYKQKNKEK